MPDFDHDPLQQLRELAAEGSRRAHGLPGEQVRALGARRHRRRMVAGMAAASVAVIVVAGGAFAAAGQITGSAPPPPAGTPTVVKPSEPWRTRTTAPGHTISPRETRASAAPSSPETSPSASPSPSPTVSATQPPTHPVAEEPTVPTQSPTRAPTRPPWILEIPEDFPMAMGMQPGGGDFSAPQRSDTLDADWVLDPCTPTVYLSDEHRQDFRTVEQTGPEYGDVRQLGLFPDSATAQELMAQFSRALAACQTQQLEEDPRYEKRWDIRSLDSGEEGVLAIASHYFRDEPIPGATYVAVVRVGNAVLAVAQSNEGSPGPGEEDAVSRDLRALAADFAAEMCNFAEDGC